MKIAKVVGTVTLARSHIGMATATLRYVEPLVGFNKDGTEHYGDDTIVAWDLCGAREGDLIAMAEGPEAAQPFRPEVKPIDASIVAILDEMTLE